MSDSARVFVTTTTQEASEFVRALEDAFETTRPDDPRQRGIGAEVGTAALAAFGTVSVRAFTSLLVATLEQRRIKVTLAVGTEGTTLEWSGDPRQAKVLAEDFERLMKASETLPLVRVHVEDGDDSTGDARS